jgi:hypothetical protein
MWKMTGTKLKAMANLKAAASNPAGDGLGEGEKKDGELAQEAKVEDQ